MGRSSDSLTTTASATASRRKKGGRPSPREIAAVASAAFLASLIWSTPAPASVLANGLRLVDRNYLFSDELDAARLLGEALEHVEVRIPELRAEKLDDRSYLVGAGSCRLRLEAPPEARVPDLAPVLDKVAALVERCVGKLPGDLPPVESLLLGGVLSGLDPYSTVFDARRKTEHAIQFRGKLAGIGARIGIRDENLTLVIVYPDSPAHRAGLRDDDIVHRVDGVSTTNMAVSDAVERIRGKVGTPVQLTVEREGVAEEQTYTVTRGLVTIPSVTAHKLDDSVVYASISHFSQTTPVDFRRRVGELVGTGGKAGVIIDLRGNSGGSMLGSSAIGDLFLDEGLLITTAGRRGSRVSGLTDEIRATRKTPFFASPVAILTSPRTASGSELLAASLRNNDRAILIGEKTFGKGTVQKTYSLGADSSIKLTVGHFLPNGVSIPGGGLTPDVEVRRLVVRDSAVRYASLRGNDDLPFWLRTPEWLSSESERNPVVINLVEVVGDEDEEDQAEEEPGDDPVVRLAAEVLRRHGNVAASRMVADARVLLAVRAKEANRNIEEHLTGVGVDWREAPPTDASHTSKDLPAAALRVALEPAGGMLRAGEKGSVTVTVENTSDRPLYRIHGVLASDVGLLRGRGLLFGYLAPGATGSWTLEVEPPANLRTARLAATVELWSGSDRLASSEPLYLAVDESARPRLAHRIAVAAGEEPSTFDVTVEFENRGDAPASEVRAFIAHPESDDVELIDGTATIEKIPAGETARASLRLRRLVSSEMAPVLDLLISEPTYRLFIETKLTVERTDGLGPWREAPQIVLGGLRPAGDEGYRVVADVIDDSGLALLYSRLDGDQVDYLEADGSAPRRLTIELPWRPNDDVRRMEIVATDADGLTTRFVTEL